MSLIFKALKVSEAAPKEFRQEILEQSTDDLPEGEVLIKVSYSSLNFKDALSATGNKGVTRNYPHTPGIDAVGEVVESSDPQFKPGDKVVASGYDLGMNTHGGFGEYIRVPGSWLIFLPAGMSEKQSMVWGTAGFTAALSVERLLQFGSKPDKGPVVVSGASGGVGSLAVALLSKLGFEVVASTGKPHAKTFLENLGAKEVIDRSELNDESKKAFLKAKYAAAIDTVGGNTLVTILKSLKYGGLATCCGMVHSPIFTSTVFPFILKGVGLLGIDSVNIPIEERQKTWNKMAMNWNINYPENLIDEIQLAELPDRIGKILKGEILGRVIIKI